MKKVRTDFVTNSSSTSYCIVGVAYSACKIKEGEYDFDAYSVIDGKGLELGAIGGDEEYGVVGLGIEGMKDDVTMGEFKQAVLDKINKGFPEAKLELKDIDVHVDGGYDG